MPVRLVQVGDIHTVVSTRFETKDNGCLVEHVTITKAEASDNPRLRLLKRWEREKDWSTGEWLALNPSA